MRCLVILFVFVVLPVSGIATTLNVPADYSTIQGAIVAAVDGDTVLVAPGTYFESINFSGKDITVKSSAGPHMTVIDGSQNGRVVLFTAGEGPDSVIEGFTICNGLASHSAGIYCNGTSPTITGNIIENNTAQTAGGIGCEPNSAPTISNNIIRNNKATGTLGGGGLGLDSFCSPEIVNNLFIGNEATGYSGGGIGMYSGCKPTLMNNIFAMNTAAFGGGGIGGLGSSPILINNTFFGNTAGVRGGALGFVNGSVLNVVNTIFWGNSAPTGPQIRLSAGPTSSSLDIDYSDVQGGKAGISLESGCVLNWGSGMIDADPLFADEGECDFHLTYLSPCKDAGDNMAYSLPGEDNEGDPRVAEGTVDMGADEFFTHLYLTGDTTPTGNVEIKFVGLPGDLINGLLIGVNIFDPPLPCDYGLWFMDNPFQVVTGFGAIPADGIRVFPGTIPATTPAPLTVYLQAAIDSWLTNLFTVNIQ